jgi:hypothetical protein
METPYMRRSSEVRKGAQLRMTAEYNMRHARGLTRASINLHKDSFEQDGLPGQAGNDGEAWERERG